VSVRALAAAALFAVLSASTGAEERTIVDAVLILEATLDLPGRVGSAAPPRFVMMRGGAVFVGGSEAIYTAALSKDEYKAIERRLKDLRKAGLLAPASFGGDERRRFHLRVQDGDRSDVVLTGDPEAAPPSLRPLAALVQDLLAFDHRDLRRYVPEGWALGAVPGDLAGGCRPWTFPVQLENVLRAPLRVDARDVERWPTGASPAQVCSGGLRYVVTLRPLLPGEQP